ncbi:hypothetical protein [Natrialba sp. PRR66]|uniref:hypothetical protein n=1 Tax=Natrialba sp. PRR66 TaxID=3098146 RepID=UPI002B1D53F3|nr:hypothetical protein [Natrialba sp. PRR66]
MTDQRPVGVALENRLMSHGIYVTAFETAGSDGNTTGTAIDDGTRIELEYETVSETPGITSDEVGAVLRTLLAIADEREWQPGRLEVTSLTPEGDRRGTWHVECEWFDRLSADLSQVEFSQRVLETVTQEALD